MDLEEMKRRDAELEAEIASLRAALNNALLEQRELRIESIGVKVGDIVLAKLSTGEPRVEATVRGYYSLPQVGSELKPWLKVSKRKVDGKFSKIERTAYHWERAPDEADQ